MVLGSLLGYPQATCAIPRRHFSNLHASTRSANNATRRSNTPPSDALITPPCGVSEGHHLSLHLLMRSLKGPPPPFHCADSIQEIPHTLTPGLMRVACSLPLFLHAAQTNTHTHAQKGNIRQEATKCFVSDYIGETKHFVLRCSIECIDTTNVYRQRP